MKISEDVILSNGTKLCLDCGLCCMGYFHVAATIDNSTDLLLAEKMGASVSIDKNNEQVFALPCLKFTGICTVYPERPSVCINHQCDLLKSVNIEKISFENAKNISAEMKELCTSIKQELDLIAPDDYIQRLESRFKLLFTSKNYTEIQKNYPKLFLKYAAYLVLKNRYFYKQNDSAIENTLF